MEPLLYVMAILGCGEGDAPCAELGLTGERYESRDACLAATEAELVRRADLPYPVVVAQCRGTDERPRPLQASEVLLPDHEDNADAPPSRRR